MPLKRRKKKERQRRPCARVAIVAAAMLAGLALFASGFLLFAGIYAREHLDFSADAALFESAKGGNVTVFYYDGSPSPSGELDGYLPTEIRTAAKAENQKLWFSLDEMPDTVKNAAVAVEDRKFYEHRGVDLLRTVYALANAIFHFRGSFGASTITQQVIKNISGDSEPTVRRKWNEILRAIELEKRYTKEEILEVYLNILPMSENAIGIGAGAKTYFGKDPADLTLAESAVLIGIANAPTRYNPYLHPEECLAKRDLVLAAMRDDERITEQEYRDALATALGVIEKSERDVSAEDWFLETVEADVVRDLAAARGIGEAAARSLLAAGGYAIYTTENPAMQEVMNDYFSDLSHFPSAVGRGLQYAMCVCDPRTGNLLCTVGGVGPKTADRLLNYATAPHTPGSALKPLALYAPLINEKRIHAATVFDDVPVDFSSGVPYPANSPAVYDGLITVKDALKLSKNTVAMRLYAMRDPKTIFRELKEDYGFDTLTERSGNLTDLAPAPLALGQISYGVSLRKLTEAYTVFASEGILRKGRSYLAVYDSTGRLVLENPSGQKRLYRPEAALIMNQLLSGVTEAGTARAVTLKNLVDTAGKTGTSGGDRDRLFIGYTPYLVGGIWCGYEDGAQEIGNHAPSHLKIWDEVMTRLHAPLLSGLRDDEVRSFSAAGLLRESFCRDSGERYAPICTLDPRGSRLDSAFFEPDNRPEALCTRHVACRYDALTEAIACENCPEEEVIRIALLDIPDRSFPMEITVTDAQYVYRKLPEGAALPEGYTEAYFVRALPPGTYAGRSKGEKQYNSFCYLHNGA